MMPITRDLNTLPTKLLPLFKQHQRIDHGDEDLLLADYLRQCIDYFEIKTETSVFKTEWAFSPAKYFESALKIPSPVAAGWAVKDAGDVALAGFSIDARGSYGVPINYLTGAWVSGMKVTLTTGYNGLPGDAPAPTAPLPPGIQACIFRLTGHLNDHREIYLANAMQMMAPWMDQLLGGYWNPRA